MSNIPTAPGNVGFPQAYGQNQNQQYQHVQQFSQFSQPSAAPLNNAPPNYAANPFPFPTATTSQEPVKPVSQIPNGAPSYQYNHAAPNYPTAASAFPAHSAGFSHQPPSFSPATQPSMNGHHAPPPPAVSRPPAFPTPPPSVGSAAPSIQPPIPSALASARPAPFPAAQPPPAPTPTPSYQQQMAPRPQAPAAYPPASQQQGYPPQPQQNSQYGQPQVPQPQMQNMNQQFGQMNMSGAPGPQQQMGGYRNDIIDLIAERNVQQLGFEDIEIQIPQQVANPNAHVDPNIFRSTLAQVPQTEELLKKSRLPFAITLHPFRDVKNLNIIQTSNIVRCRYCRTYINPYVYLPDHRHWKCNLCNRNNDLPDDFCWDQ